MRTYGQYCPIARASEVLAERWTPIILRNLLLGSSTFTEIADGAPGLSRTLLTTRLRELERAGVVERSPNPTGRGSLYHLTEAGKDLADVMAALGTWGERWMELAPEHLDPGVVLHSWVSWYLARERLPDRRVVVRFEFPGLPKKGGVLWIIFDGARSEVCRTDPLFEVDLFVEADPSALAEWHLGRIEWVDALLAERIRVEGPPSLGSGASDLESPQRGCTRQGRPAAATRLCPSDLNPLRSGGRTYAMAATSRVGDGTFPWTRVGEPDDRER